MTHPRHQSWLIHLLLVLLLWATACAPAVEQRRPAPTGRYDGKLSYRGSELPVELHLYQDSVSGAVQLVLRVPEAPVLSRLFDSVLYEAPTFRAERGSARLILREEPNFLTGSIWLNDTLQTELIAVRRGPAATPAYRISKGRLNLGGEARTTRRFIPLDTLPQRVGLVLLPAPGNAGAAYGWADWLAGHGLVVELIDPAAEVPDSLQAAFLAAAARNLLADRSARVDSTRLGAWGTGTSGRSAVQALIAGQLPAAFLVVQGAEFTKTDGQLLRQLTRRRVRLLGLYGAADTTINVRRSSQLLRNAMGKRGGSGISVFPKATAQLLLPASATPADSTQRGLWPRPVPGLATEVTQWLRQQNR